MKNNQNSTSNAEGRESGYYWVKVFENDWQISFYSHGTWDCQDFRSKDDSFFEEIDPTPITRQTETVSLKSRIFEYVQHHHDKLYKDMVFEDRLDFDTMSYRLTEFAEYLFNTQKTPIENPAHLLEKQNDIDVVGNCAKCGTEFHIHRLDSISSTPETPKEVLEEALAALVSSYNFIDGGESYRIRYLELIKLKVFKSISKLRNLIKA